MSTKKATFHVDSVLSSERATTLDADALAQLRAIGDCLLRRVASMFADALPNDIKHLANAISEGNDDVARSVAHRVKSSARTLGAMDLGNLLEHVEHNARTGYGYDNTSLRDKVLAETSRTLTAVRQLANSVTVAGEHAVST